MPRRVFMESVKKAVRRQAQISALHAELDREEQIINGKAINKKWSPETRNVNQIDPIQNKTNESLWSPELIVGARTVTPPSQSHLHSSHLECNEHNTQSRFSRVAETVQVHNTPLTQSHECENAHESHSILLTDHKITGTLAHTILSSQSLEQSASNKWLHVSSSEMEHIYDALRITTNKTDVMKMFTEVTQLHRNALTPQLLQRFTLQLLKIHVASMMTGGTDLSCDSFLHSIASDNDAPERWRGLDVEEERVLLHHACARCNRYCERSLQYSALAKANIEGTDNDHVACMEYYIRANQSELLSHGVAPLLDTVHDLMYLDIGWRTAMRVCMLTRELTLLEPPITMTDELLRLMTGYKSNGLGSRPWEEAWHIYTKIISTDERRPTLRTYTAALDALWRRADNFHKLHQSTISPAVQDDIWNEIVSIQQAVQASYHENHHNLCGENQVIITGESGCAFMESLVKALCACNRHTRAIELLQQMDLTHNDISFRLLVPTAETYLFIIAACYASGELSRATAIRELFDGLHYNLRSVHSECLLVYLQSLRHVTEKVSFIGNEVAELVGDGNGLDRPCTVACLHLLAHPSVIVTTTNTTPVTSVSYERASGLTRNTQISNSIDYFSKKETSHTPGKSELAQILLHYYTDNNLWIQHAGARKVELCSVFRCCYIIDSLEKERGSTFSIRLMEELEQFIHSTFGSHSYEAQWLRNTEIYELENTSNYNTAISVYNRFARHTGDIEDNILHSNNYKNNNYINCSDYTKYIDFLAQRAELPLPIRQIHEMVLNAFLRSFRGVRSYEKDGNNSTVSWALIDDEAQEQDLMLEMEKVRTCVSFVSEMYNKYECNDETLPHASIAELTLLYASHIQSKKTEQTDRTKQRQLIASAIRELSYCSAPQITHSIVELAAQLLNTTELHMETALIEQHAKLRYRSWCEERTLRIEQIYGYPRTNTELLSAFERIYE